VLKISGNFERSVFHLALILASALVGAGPAPAQTFSVLHTFTGGADGGTPFGTPILLNGNIYGTTSGGGTHGLGTLYQLNFLSRVETVLHSFGGAPLDGSGPLAGLVADASGNFYGVTFSGGTHNLGTAFKLTSGGTFTLLHSFAGHPREGSGPAGTLVFDASGDLFGTTYVGGDSTGWGTVFEISAAGAYTTGQSFSPDGALPRAGLHLDSGVFYGTTCGGGAHTFGGTVFAVGTNPALYTFTGGADGAQPLGSLISDSQGNLYGTASAGGSGPFGLGDGVIFKLNITTAQLTVLHTFNGPDGASPAAGLVQDSAGNMYGTTLYGGTAGYGTVFELDSLGNFTTIYNFTGGSDGAKPFAGLIVDSHGNLWGAASSGGSAPAPGGYGTLFFIAAPA
jgi:uncharacterized repeat protein (TIGR03803 family)